MCVRLACGAVLGAILGALALAGAGVAQTRTACGDIYEVRRGDTLREIALAVYGDKLEDVIHDANRAVIGPNPWIIEVGAPLWLPCLDAEKRPIGARPVAEAPAAEPTPARAAALTLAAPSASAPVAPAALGGKLLLLTGSGHAPYADADLDQGGVAPAMLREAMRAVGVGDTRIVFVDDWKPHLDVLLGEGLFHAGFPWRRPNCEATARLTAADHQLCQGFVFSQPLLETRIGLFTQASDPRAAEGALALQDARICAAGPTPGLTPTSRLSQSGLSDCLDMLSSGRVDAVAAPVEAMRVLAPAGVAQAQGYAETVTLHVIASRNHPRARQVIALINEGLTQLRTSGAWFEIYNSQMARHRAQALSRQPRG